MKLAYFSPLGPQRSGISDYSEELLPHLANDAEITLFVDGFQPSNPLLNSRFEVRDYRRRPSHLLELESFDAVMYHMGNDHRYHSGIFDAIMQRPGIVVLHDFALQDFFLGLARERNQPDIYLSEVDFNFGNRIRNDAADSMTRGGTPAIASQPLDYPLNKRILNSAEAVIVHSDWAKWHLSQISDGTPIAHIPHLINIEQDSENTTLEVDETRIASFGLITPGKGIELALRALAKLRNSYRFRYTLVGEPNSFYDVRRLVSQYGLQDVVEITGHVGLERFKQHMRDTDIALNLRERTVGETSGCLCRLMATGTCAVVVDAGWYGDLPDDCVVKVPLDSTTEDVLFAYLERLIKDRPLRKRIGDNARRYANENHEVSRVAQSYLDFTREVIARRSQRSLVASVSAELAQLGAKPSDEICHSVAQDLSLLLCNTTVTSIAAKPQPENGNGQPLPSGTEYSSGRTPKVSGIDYKDAARRYLSVLPDEWKHYLRTKPFYNLANKPEKYRFAGMDEDTHRHFCDFANIAVSLALPPGSRILDVGCGSGWLSEYFARLGYIVKGIDISSDLIEMSRERVARVPYSVDHETPLQCSFEVHDVELGSLSEKFDAIICYDSLHHFENEQAVIGNFAKMVDVGGTLFILEGDRPPAGSKSEEELINVMRTYGTLESPFNYEYLRRLLDENGFAIIGDYASINGLFPRESIIDNSLPLRNIAINYNYLACKKVVEGKPASTIADSKRPGLLRARLELLTPPPTEIKAGQIFSIEISIKNEGDTLWIGGRETRTGIVMPAVKILDATDSLVRESHGDPPLPHSIAPGELVRLKMEIEAPLLSGDYTLKVDLVNQHVCWFEDVGSQPLLLNFKVR